MSAYRGRPWLARCRERQPASIEPECRTMLELFRASADRAPRQVALRDNPHRDAGDSR